VAIEALVSGREAGERQPFYLQVGAFGVAENAQRLQHQLTESGLDQVRVERTRPSSGAVLYKVWVGPFSDAGVADRATRKLASLGFKDYHIVAGP
jgi:rare lipoprotein A